jgi:hypothetical protein
MAESLFWWQALKVHRTDNGAVMNKYQILGRDRNHAKRILHETELNTPTDRTFGLHKVGTHDDYMDVFGVDGQYDLDI